MTLERWKFSLIILLVTVLSCEGVPAAASPTCIFPEVWRDVWIQAGSNSSFSILANTWGSLGRCALQLDPNPPGVFPYIVKSRSDKCYICLQIHQLHPNVIRYKESECRQEKDVSRLCFGEISQLNWRYIFRSAAQVSPCPSLLSGSHSFSYSEFSPSQQSYVQGCGEPRSESNECSQRSEDDPQLSISFGNCPEGTLVHRTSMTQTLKCIGSWQIGGVQYMMTTGESWEYWEPGDYRHNDKEMICMALETDGLKIYLAQGFGSGCSGMGGELSPRNGIRNLVLEKRLVLEENCNFPEWATRHTAWQVVPQGGVRMSGQKKREVVFTSDRTFRLGMADDIQGQIFSCAKILKKSDTEVLLQTFSRAQCFGEYHCFHAVLDPTSGMVDLHVGAPSANIEYSCVSPSFDPDVPFLMATLLPSSISVSNLLPRTQDRPGLINLHQGQINPSPDKPNTIGEMELVERETEAQIFNLAQQFSEQVSAHLVEYMRKIRAMCVGQ